MKAASPAGAGRVYEELKRLRTAANRVLGKTVSASGDEEVGKALDRARALLQRIPPGDIAEAVREARDAR